MLAELLCSAFWGQLSCEGERESVPLPLVVTGQDLTGGQLQPVEACPKTLLPGCAGIAVYLVGTYLVLCTWWSQPFLISLREVSFPLRTDETEALRR